MTLAQETRLNRVHSQILRSLGSEGTKALNDDKVIELMLNPDGKLWIDKLGEGMSIIGSMDANKATTFINNIASAKGKTVTYANPILECEFPIDGSRFEGLIPPAVAAPTFALRKKARLVFTLDDYIEQGGITERQKEVIINAITHRKNLLIVGATSSGKTTFANAVIHAMHEYTPEDRLVIIEDTNEIQSKSENTTQLHTSDESGIDMQRLLRVTLRMRPDRILVGEVRGGEALQLVKAWNTGHPGGLATVHANSAHAGLKRMGQMIGEASVMPMNELVAEAIHLIFFLEKTPEGRKVTQMIEVEKWSETEKMYITNDIN